MTRRYSSADDAISAYGAARSALTSIQATDYERWSESLSHSGGVRGGDPYTSERMVVDRLRPVLRDAKRAIGTKRWSEYERVRMSGRHEDSWSRSERLLVAAVRAEVEHRLSRKGLLRRKG